MKQLLGYTATVVILMWVVAVVAFNAGAQKQRRFEALCGEPGVRCIVRFTSGYLVAHHGSFVPFPRYTVAELGDERGGMQ